MSEWDPCGRVCEADKQTVLEYSPHLMNPNSSEVHADKISAESSSGLRRHSLSIAKRQ